MEALKFTHITNGNVKWDSHFFLPLNNSAPSSWAFGLGLISLALWVLLSTNHTSWIDMLVVACVCVCVCVCVYDQLCLTLWDPHGL